MVQKAPSRAKFAGNRERGTGRGRGRWGERAVWLAGGRDARALEIALVFRSRRAAPRRPTLSADYSQSTDVLVIGLGL